MKTKLTLLASTTLALLVLSAPANAAGNGWYVNLSGGANWLTDDGFVAVAGPDTLIFSPDPNTGWIISGAVGLSLNNMVQGLRVEAEVAYRQNQVDGVWASDTGPGNDAGLLDYDHSTVSVLANVWYDFDLGNVRPYIGGGVGWAETDLDGRFQGGTIPAINYSDDGFAWQAGAGVNFDISPNVQLGLGYRYFEGPDVRIGAPFGANSATGDVQSHNHAAIVSLTYGM